MRFLVEDFSALLCFPDDFGIAVPVFSYLEAANSIINCIITDQIVAYQIVQNYLISSTIFNVLHTFQKVKCYIFHWNVAFSSIQTVHVFTIIIFVSALKYPNEDCAIT